MNEKERKRNNGIQKKIMVLGVSKWELELGSDND